MKNGADRSFGTFSPTNADHPIGPVVFVKKPIFLILILFVLLLPLSDASASEGISVGVEDGWIWQIVLLPPPSGWESDSGISALAAVRCEEKSLAESAGGAAGRDVHFLKEEALTSDNVLPRLAEWRERKIAAVLSFDDGGDAALLAPLLGTAGPVFLSAWGEGIDLRGEKGPAPLMFALDLFQDFRVAAFTRHAGETLSPGVPVAILGDRLDPTLDANARNLADRLMAGNFSVSTYWIAGGGIDSFNMIGSEVMSSGAEVFISLAGTMVVRDLWLGSRRQGHPFSLWYCGMYGNFLRAFEGVLLADQNFPLTLDRTLVTLGREIRKKQKVFVRDEPLAGRAAACCSWLFKALGRAGSADPLSLAGAMEKAEGIQLGSQILFIDPATHRPKEREVAFLTVQKGNFHPLKILSIRGER